MAIKMNEKDFALVDSVLDDYDKEGHSDKKCPYCGTIIIKEETSSSFSVHCQTDNCFRETFRGL